MYKKVLIVTDNVPEQINGVVTTFNNLELWANRHGYNFIYCDPRQFPNCGAPGYGDIRLSWPQKVGEVLRWVEPDYVHIATEGPLGLAARCWMDYHGWRYNTSYHTRIPEALSRYYKIPESWTYKYLRWFHKHSGKVLATTQSMVSELKSRGFRGDIVAWTRGVDRSLFWQGPGSENKYPTLLWVGRVSVEKNCEDFCKLHYPAAKKIVVGGGPQLEYLQEKYPQVEFVGMQLGKALAKYYQSADCLVFTSRWDTFGIVMLEAMACGTPVAGYPVCGPRDVIEPGFTGSINEDLLVAVKLALAIPREVVLEHSLCWSWQHCWQIFEQNLVRRI
jgi:glycosyltransferase involved in cell wall biosynthesis